MAHHHDSGSWREKLHEIIFEADTSSGKLFDLMPIVCIIASVAAAILETDSPRSCGFGGCDDYGLQHNSGAYRDCDGGAFSGIQEGGVGAGVPGLWKGGTTAMPGTVNSAERSCNIFRVSSGDV